MAIDTASKRASALGVAIVSTLLVVPSGAIAQGERQTIGVSYSGILADIPVIDTPDCYEVLSSEIIPILAASGLINDTPISVTGEIEAILSCDGFIDGSDIVLSGVLDTKGLNVNSKIQDSFNINALLCDCE